MPVAGAISSRAPPAVRACSRCCQQGIVHLRKRRESVQARVLQCGMCAAFVPMMGALMPSTNAMLCCRCNCLGALSALPDLGCPSLEHEVVGEVHLHRHQIRKKQRDM